MKRTKLAVLAAGAALFLSSTSAQAALCLGGTYGAASSTGTGLTTNVTPNATSCVGYINGNTIFNANGANVTTVKAMLTALGFDWSATNFGALYADTGSKLSNLNGATSISFGDAPMLFGDTYIGIHWGGSGGGRNAIYKLTLTAPVSSLTILSQNPGGSSDAVLFGTQPYSPVPEAASWIYLIAGFGAMGGALRRRTVRASIAA